MHRPLPRGTETRRIGDGGQGFGRHIYIKTTPPVPHAMRRAAHRTFRAIIPSSKRGRSQCLVCVKRVRCRCAFVSSRRSSVSPQRAALTNGRTRAFQTQLNDCLFVIYQSLDLYSAFLSKICYCLSLFYYSSDFNSFIGLNKQVS